MFHFIFYVFIKTLEEVWNGGKYVVNDSIKLLNLIFCVIFQ